MKKLKKQLRLYDVFSICTGAMFSSGFFLLPGIAAAQTGDSVYLTYLASGILIIPAMLSVAELSTAMPKSGGAYYFLDRSMGPMIGTIGGLGSWVALMFKSAFALIGMGAYLSLFIDVPITEMALILTLVFGLLNVFGAKETTLLQRILVSILISIMFLYIVQGLLAVLNPKSAGLIQDQGAFFKNDIHGFISTIGLVFVSYAGLTKVSSIAEEVENPDRNIPLGMILSLITATIIYAVGVYIMQRVLPAAEFYASLTPVADAGAQFMSWLPGNGGVIVIVVAAVAAFASTGNAGIMSASRYPFAMSRDKLMSDRFSKLSKQGTPVFAIMVTVICMILILLLFNVEAVAKLASAFQLLLFGLMCFAVIVMRESGIKGYQPGFKSPLYPWVHIAGMLISVWLIAEMGLLAVSLTGFIIILCVGWYVYYTKGELPRRGAIFHVHERLGKNSYEALEYELLDILNEKNTEQHLSYKETISRSMIMDVKDKKPDMEKLLKQASEMISERIQVSGEQIYKELYPAYQHKFNKLGKFAISMTLSYPDIQTSEILVFKFGEDADISIPGKDTPVQLFACVVIPEDEEGLDVRLMGHLAEIMRTAHFMERWKNASASKELRACLLSEEHFIHLRVRDNDRMRNQVGKRISEIQLPESCLITILYREQEIIIPHGHTVLQLNDELLMVGDPEDILSI